MTNIIVYVDAASSVLRDMTHSPSMTEEAEYFVLIVLRITTECKLGRGMFCDQNDVEPFCMAHSWQFEAYFQYFKDTIGCQDLVK